MSAGLTTAEVLEGVGAREIIALTSSLVATSSISGDERRLMEVARTYLEEHGVAVQELARDPARFNLIAMNGHLDTVPVSDPEAWETDPLAATLDGDRLYGLGALDMKGACAVMMLAATCLNRHADRLKGSLQLQLVTDEEMGCYDGTIYVVEEINAGRLPRPDMVVCGESSDLRIMNAERGSFKFNVTFRGRSSHTAWARVEGVNPILHAAHAVIALEKDLPRYHPDIGHGVISVNLIQAGHFPSTVPGVCTLLVDRRMLPGETDQSCLAEAEQAIRAALKDVPEADFELAPMIDSNGRQRYSPPNLSSWDSQLVQAVANAHRDATGQPAERFMDWYGATDGRLFRYEALVLVVLDEMSSVRVVRLVCAMPSPPEGGHRVEDNQFRRPVPDDLRRDR